MCFEFFFFFITKAIAAKDPLLPAARSGLPRNGPVTWTIKYRKENGRSAYGRTSNAVVAQICHGKGWQTMPGGNWHDSDTRKEILQARCEADVEFDGGWDGDCTRGLRKALGI